MLRFAEEKGIPVVSPLAHIERENSDVLFQLAPDPAHKYDKVADLVGPGKRVTFIATASTDREFEREMLALLERVIQVETHQIYYDSAPLSMGYVYDLEKALSPDLRARLTYPAYHPRWPEDLNRQESMIEQIRRKDRLLFFPFDSIDPFLRLLEEAADRPPSRSPFTAWPPPPRLPGFSAGRRRTGKRW